MFHYQAAITDLLSKVDASSFEAKFGSPMAMADSLIEAKTVTVAKLMEIAPVGTMDPTPFLYDTSFYSIAAAISTWVGTQGSCYIRDLGSGKVIWSPYVFLV